MSTSLSTAVKTDFHLMCLTSFFIGVYLYKELIECQELAVKLAGLSYFLLSTHKISNKNLIECTQEHNKNKNYILESLFENFCVSLFFSLCFIPLGISQSSSLYASDSPRYFSHLQLHFRNQQVKNYIICVLFLEMKNIDFHYCFRDFNRKCLELFERLPTGK